MPSFYLSRKNSITQINGSYFAICKTDIKNGFKILFVRQLMATSHLFDNTLYIFLYTSRNSNRTEYILSKKRFVLRKSEPLRYCAQTLYKRMSSILSIFILKSPDFFAEHKNCRTKV